VEAAASATSIPDLFGRLEECKELKRLDSSIEPTMYRAPFLSDLEVEQLQSIENVVRAGRVRRIQSDRIVFDDGDVPAGTDPLYVDCTADGLPATSPRPIFEPNRITIQGLREGSPTFNAALIGYLEASRDDVVEQNSLAPPNPYPSSATDWIRTRHRSLMNQVAWNRQPDLVDWIERSRLNLAAGLGKHASEPGVGQALGSYFENTGRAIENLAAFRAELGDDVTSSN
jgi:hypothetical protein